MSAVPQPIIDPAALIQAHEASIYRAMVAIYTVADFKAVVLATSRAQKRLADERREAIARDGWIA